ncbi:MAG: hypothetical protein ABIF10_07680 [Candidatus Woesearchaeota archaeon]
MLRLLLTSFGTDYSINLVARECGLSPNGAYKILAKFENEGILFHKKIANLKSYKLNFQDSKVLSVLELALIPDLDKKIRFRLDDLGNLRNIAKTCIIFGSYLSAKEPQDLDILFVLDSSSYQKYSREMEKARQVIPFKVHDVVQTVGDLQKNIRQNDAALMNILRTGKIVWGQDVIIRVIKNVYR